MEFNITINAPKEKVWHALWDDTNYRAWASAFAEGSWAKTDDWKKGSKVLFLGNEGSGMVSQIEDNIPNEYMSIKHLGMVKDGVEDTTSSEIQQWAGAMENYRLKEVNGKTELNVFMTSDGMEKQMLDYFSGTWPKALDKLKAIAENA
jgi:hypothetical protein